MTRQSGHDIEIWYGLSGGEPSLIGGGSFKDVERAFREADQQPPCETCPGQAVSPRTESFYRSMAQNAGVTPQYEAAMEHHGTLIETARQDLRDGLSGETGQSGA